MRTDTLGIPIYSTHDIFDLILQGKLASLSDINVEADSELIKEFNTASTEFGDIQLTEYRASDIEITEFDATLQQNWLMPDAYKQLDIEAYLVEQCPAHNYQRLIDELAAYKERNMLDLLRWMKYFVDTCRTNNVTWGVGRGSSVASYVLYLIGVHKIDSIKYNLDWQEFLR